MAPVVHGTPAPEVLAQMAACLAHGSPAGGVLCADAAPADGQPHGSVVAHHEHIAVTGVGPDIACGHLAMRLDVPAAALRPRLSHLVGDLARSLSFGAVRRPGERADAAVFDDDDAWRFADAVDGRPLARAQFGTVGGGDHCVALYHDEDGLTWIAVHFGARGLGHRITRRYATIACGTAAGPALLPVASEAGQRYLAALDLAGRYAHAAREWVAGRVQGVIGGAVTDIVHHHHTFAWREKIDGASVWVARKGATPVPPGGRAFVAGAPGDHALIVEGVDGPAARRALHSTVHGARRLLPRRAARGRLTREDMLRFLAARSVVVSGGRAEDGPLAFERLDDTMAAQDGVAIVLRRLRPLAVLMAPETEVDPFGD